MDKRTEETIFENSHPICCDIRQSIELDPRTWESEFMDVISDRKSRISFEQAKSKSKIICKSYYYWIIYIIIIFFCFILLICKTPGSLPYIEYYSKNMYGQDEFYIELSSNASFPNNTVQHFTTQLKKRLNLEGLWEVGMAAVTKHKLMK